MAQNNFTTQFSWEKMKLGRPDMHIKRESTPTGKVTAGILKGVILGTAFIGRESAIPCMYLNRPLI